MGFYRLSGASPLARLYRGQQGSLRTSSGRRGTSPYGDCSDPDASGAPSELRYSDGPRGYDATSALLCVETVHTIPCAQAKDDAVHSPSEEPTSLPRPMVA